MNETMTSGEKRLISDVKDLFLKKKNWLLDIECRTPEFKCPCFAPSPFDACPPVQNVAGKEKRIRAIIQPTSSLCKSVASRIRVELDVDTATYPSSDWPRIWVRSHLLGILDDGSLPEDFYGTISKSTPSDENLIEVVLQTFFDNYLRERALRFKVGDKVLANMGEWVHGEIVATWVHGHPYCIRILSDNEEVYAPCDSNIAVRSENVEDLTKEINNTESDTRCDLWTQNLMRWTQINNISNGCAQELLHDPNINWENYINPEISTWLRSEKSLQPPSFAEKVCSEVFSFQLFSSEFCKMLIDEYERCEAFAEKYSIPIRRPNSMNNYGCIMSEVGMGSLIDSLQDNVLCHIASSLFGPILGCEMTSHHSFLVQYSASEDRGLDMHTDDSDITFNICLGKQFIGSTLQFCGVLGTPGHRHHLKSYVHSLGKCVVHAGSRRHGADDIIDGERVNLIIWNRNKVWRRSSGFMHPIHQIKYEKESGPPDPVCISRTHDKDWNGPRTKGSMQPWCPPDFAKFNS